MANLTNKLNKAYAREVKQTMKAKSRSANLDWLKVKLEETKKDAVHKFTESEEFNHQMVLNRRGQGMADHSLVHAVRKKTKDMDLMMDL
ncbi:unnamed protein product [Prunus armeniaca]